MGFQDFGAQVIGMGVSGFCRAQGYGVSGFRSLGDRDVGFQDVGA